MAFMEQSHGLPAILSFQPPEKVASALGSPHCHAASPKTQTYIGLWSQLVALPVPGYHLQLIVAILSLGALYGGWVNDSVACLIMDSSLTEVQIKALRTALPRLPSELNVVLAAHKYNSTCAITLVPILPVELDTILSPSLDQATIFRHVMNNFDLTVDSVITPTTTEMTSLRSELENIPEYLGHGFAISNTKIRSLCNEHTEIATKLDAVRNIKTYSAWFAMRNALNFAEGVTRFGKAVNTLNDGALKVVYLRFYEHFKALAHSHQD